MAGEDGGVPRGSWGVDEGEERSGLGPLMFYKGYMPKVMQIFLWIN